MHGPERCEILDGVLIPGCWAAVVGHGCYCPEPGRGVRAFLKREEQAWHAERAAEEARAAAELARRLAIADDAPAWLAKGGRLRPIRDDR